MSTARGRRRSTIHDVARHAGVSITTVSHSLNGKGVVAKATRQRVIEVAAELGYSADAIARGLRSNRLGLLGLVIRPLDTLGSYQPEGVDYFLRFAGAAAVEALDCGYGLVLMRDPTAGNAPGIALAADGFIISDPLAGDPVIDLLTRNAIPLVAVGRDVERPDFTAWLGGGTLRNVDSVIAHLHERGAKRIALVTGTDDNSWNADSENSYREWAAENDQSPIVYNQDERLGEEGGREIADQLLASDAPLPDAIYCLTGRHAAGIQAGLQAAGCRIPDDVMIVAGSDSEQTRNSTPPITSVDLAPEATAKAAVAYLVALLEAAEDDQPAPPEIEYDIRDRASTRRG
ncbi:LacI family transcriptional regulator [Salinibacterium amurskyense]|uniref:LacI family transcriptional regulator n=1 Tax=Salinibacterium amurskyense TaxID=205941 RepID=A0A2M9D285_9MICO|nr:LacI family DNA-binding transcriptional regulator [Salinibacterium amurskyense]PJJ78286.1 LacI family transcriptional regulator [Salinibacterium amurskyense]RLQ80399.1 LacI family transcriptional regulator [Salinibacterium amurskyense]